MIKKYNQFVNDRINEDVELDDIDTNQQEAELANRDLEDEMGEIPNETPEMDFGDGRESFGEDAPEVVASEEEMEEEGGDVYASKLREVADKLGSEVTNGKIEYNGQKIMFPSETEMFHVGGKKFKTADEVVSFLEGPNEESENKQDVDRRESDRLGDIEADQMDEDERYAAMEESKSYKNTRKFK